MTIKARVVAIFATLLVLLSAIIFTMGQMAARHEKLAKSEHSRFESVKLADQLRQSSDDLTRMVRTYVVTGDQKYEKYFYEILAIRDGTVPRPQEYNKIYWDFVTETGKRPTSPGPPVALLDLLKRLGLSSQELARLKEAKKNSDDLTNLEKIAFAAMKGLFEDDSGNLTVERAPDPAFARRILHGEKYHKAKGSIMRPIREFMILLDQRTRREVDAIRADEEFYRNVVSILVVATILFSFFAYFHLRRRIINPVLSLARTAHRIEGGELEARASIISSDEIGALNDAFNSMIEQAHEAIKSLKVENAERKRMEEKIIHMAQHDLLTKLPNRSLFLDRLSMALSGAKRKENKVAFLFVDLDDFKPVNDNMGHDIGDKVLKEVARRISSLVREVDTVARFGGDEFTVVLTDITSKSTVTNIAKKIIKSLAKPYQLDSEEASLTCSIGIALYPEHGQTPDELIKSADVAMYTAKREGKKGIRYASRQQ